MEDGGWQENERERPCAALRHRWMKRGRTRWARDGWRGADLIRANPRDPRHPRPIRIIVGAATPLRPTRNRYSTTTSLTLTPLGVCSRHA